MPNWTFNTLQAPKKVLKKYLKENVLPNNPDKEYIFDFNLIIPMPKSLDMESGSSTDECIVIYLFDKMTKTVDEIDDDTKHLIYKLTGMNFFDKEKEEMFTNLIERIKQKYTDEEKMKEGYFLGKQYMENYLNYGALTWYEWRIANWGTKWDACDDYVDPNFNKAKANDEVWVTFNTAWSAPIPIIEKIMNDNPNCKISFFWENEDWDGKHWWKRFKNGNYSSDYDDLKAGKPLYW